MISSAYFVVPQIFVIDSLFSYQECVEEISQAESFGFQSQTFQSFQNTEVRNRAFIDDEAKAQKIWQKIYSSFPSLVEFFDKKMFSALNSYENYIPIGLNSRLRYYKYGIGELFPPHIDIYHQKSEKIRSFLTLIVYLNSDFEGGETRFEATTIVPKAGKALIFQHELTHQSLPIKKNCKYVLRSDIMYQQK